MFFSLEDVPQWLERIEYYSVGGLEKIDKSIHPKKGKVEIFDKFIALSAGA
jgi:hypothetical protein